MSDFQTPEELEAHFAEEGPVATAHRWLQLLLVDGDFEAAWQLMDYPLRVALAQHRILANADHEHVALRNRDELAEALARGDTADPLWEAFAEPQLQEFQDAWAVFVSGIGAGSRPRPVAPGYEIVLFMAGVGGEIRVFTEPTIVDNALPVLMHLTDDGWRVAHFGTKPLDPPTAPPEPGWPPKFDTW